MMYMYTRSRILDHASTQPIRPVRRAKMDFGCSKGWRESDTPARVRPVAATGAVSSTAAAATARVIARVVRVMLEDCLTLQHGGNSKV